MERMKEIGASITGFQRTLADWGKRKCLEGNLNKQRGQPVPWGWMVANMLVQKKIQTELGLNRVELCMCGSAPLSLEVQNYFMSINQPIMELYGMSEDTGPHTINRPDLGYWRSGSVGRPVEGAEVKIDSPDENGEGEVRGTPFGRLVKWEVGGPRCHAYGLSPSGADPDAWAGRLHGLPRHGGEDG